LRFFLSIQLPQYISAKLITYEAPLSSALSELAKFVQAKKSKSKTRPDSAVFENPLPPIY
jgi:hypothetical protein